MRNTVYPGRRIAPSGGTSIFVALSQIFPSLTFRFSDYQYFTGENICEIGAVGSFFPAPDPLSHALRFPADLCEGEKRTAGPAHRIRLFLRV